MKITKLLSAVILLVASCGVFAGGQGTVLNEAWAAMETDSAVQCKLMISGTTFAFCR